MPKLKDLIPDVEQQPDGLDKLTPKKQQAVFALLESRTYTEAAKAAGVDRRTIYRWIRYDKNFRDELREARREAIGETTARLKLLAGGVVDDLADIVKNKDASAASRVSGIRIILDYAYRAVELEDIEDRLIGVEQAIDEHGPQ